ncbi:FAD/NAD(P)-binding protein [Galbibacter sp. EGI 63066]|uniref:FAD/NAD(P)-binding protein n=1 Tax=Galbibacter sp. EGI 63066 TaxID=2993559 RepID=UPI00224992C2|nr:FAD/NAD(P)-binding protein [Galbibacter sp. EGI 63066]MCX2679179.1 FAD/NAD(P)-binding protein [Galbibacter sp. EGI 63066]
MTNREQKTDITFVGSGISSTFTLIYFLESIAQDFGGNTISINILNKYPEFHTGIPYGNRSGASVLLITSLKDFLPQPERDSFINWLNVNKGQLIKKMLNEGGDLTTQWTKEHALQIQNNEWEDLFVPRWFFGQYLDEKAKKLVSALEKDNRIKVSYQVAEVRDIKKTTNGFKITTNADTFSSSKVVLAIGSLPTKKLCSDVKNTNEHLLLVNNCYDPGLKENLKRIQDFTRQRKNEGKTNNVLIVGANASALELLYKLNDTRKSESYINHFTFISTHGILPDSIVDKKKQGEFEPYHLQKLKNIEDITAKDIAEATYKDLDHAESIHLGAASTVNIISNAFGALLSKLNRKELKEFACRYGNEIGRRQRCAGVHYTKTIDKLTKDSRFDHIAGRFISLKNNNIEHPFLEYSDTKTGEIKTSTRPYHIVINCIGSTTFNGENVPEILQNLIKKGICKPNESQIGIDVNKSLEATDSLYVVGPLLAGNVIENKAVWHVEHCGRITWLSKILAKELYKSFTLKDKELNTSF